MKISNTAALAPPFGAYSHVCELKAGSRMLLLAGQVGMRTDNSIPESVEEQTEVALQNILATLSEAGMGLSNIARMTVILLDRGDIKHYRAARDRIFGDILPPNTLMIVTGLANPAWKVEIEVTAAE